MASPEEGYDDERFQSPVPGNLHCNICLNVLKQPMQCVRNEHPFCKPCIHRHLQGTQKCPTCIEPLTIQTLRPSRVITGLLSELMIKCDNVGRGCPVSVKLETLEAHVATCEYSPVNCSNNGCKVMVNRRDQLHHETTECPFRLEKCTAENAKNKTDCYEKNSAVVEEMSEMRRMLTEIKTEMSTMKGTVMCVSSDTSDVTEQMSLMKQEIEDMKKEMENWRKESHTKLREDIIVVGGSTGLLSPLKTVEIYHWNRQTWSLLQPVKSIRYCSSSFVYHDQLFVCAGFESNTTEVLSLTGETEWKEFPLKLQQDIYGHSNVVYKDVSIVIGGSSMDDGVLNGICELRLNPPFACNLLCRMPEPRAFHGAQLFGDKIIIVGGTTTGAKTSSLDSVLLYDITNDRCQTLAPLPFAVSDMATVAWKDNIIIMGGRSNTRNALSDVVLYNITNQSIKILPSMLQKRAGCVAVITGDVVVVMGGRDEEKNVLSSAECFSFNEYKYEWKEFPALNEKRECATAVVKYS